MTLMESLRSFRLGEYAVFDFVVTFLAIYLLAPYLTKLFRKIRLDVPRYNWLYLALPIGILFHLLIGTITPMTRDFIDTQGHYFLKIVIVVLVVLGVRGIKVLKKSR